MIELIPAPKSDAVGQSELIYNFLYHMRKGIDAGFSVTGGVRIGWLNASWPFAKLILTSSVLTLRSLRNTYDFLPSQVVTLERYRSIPFFSGGIRIIHARSDYPSKIIFWYFGNPDDLIEKIRGVGFLPTAPAAAEIKWRGIPIRWSAIISFTLIWNALFLPMLAFAKPPWEFALIPLVTTFLVCWAIRAYPQLQKIILREGRSVNEIKAYLSGIETVTGLLAVVFAVLALILPQ